MGIFPFFQKNIIQILLSPLPSPLYNLTASSAPLRRACVKLPLQPNGMALPPKQLRLLSAGASLRFPLWNALSCPTDLLLVSQRYSSFPTKVSSLLLLQSSQTTLAHNFLFLFSTNSSFYLCHSFDNQLYNALWQLWYYILPYRYFPLLFLVFYLFPLTFFFITGTSLKHPLG